MIPDAAPAPAPGLADALVRVLAHAHGFYAWTRCPLPAGTPVPGRALVVGAAAHAITGRFTDVQLAPNTDDLPGGSVLQQLMNGLGGWALALALVGLVVGAAAWALGSHGQNYQQTYVGRRAVLISGLAALLIGAGPAIVNFFFHAGQGVH
jgi:hypothetical protein